MRDTWLVKAFCAGLGVLLLYAAARMVSPFLSALLAAGMLAMILAPLRLRLLHRVSNETAASAVLTGLTLLLLVFPLALAGWTVLREAAHAYPAAKLWLESAARPLDALEPAGKWPRLLKEGLGYIESQELSLKGIAFGNLDWIGSWATGAARNIIKNASSLVLNLIMFAVFLFFFLRDGPGLVAEARLMLPLPPKDQDLVLLRIRGLLNAVIEGIFAVALVQGLLAVLGFALFGVPFPVLLGALCALLSPIPFVGSALIWAPVVLRLSLAGDFAKAAPLLLWFILIVGLSDNVVRPLLIGARTKIPLPLVILGVLGGVKAFGFTGLFLGPLVAAILAVAWEMFHEKYGASPPPL